MQKLVKAFGAFCVATVLAQIIILILAAARGNLKQETLLKGIALVNGVDISAEHLQQALQDSRNTPNPTYEDVVEERARLDRDLDMRQKAIEHEKEQVSAMLAELQKREVAFDRRTTEFYELLDKKEKNLLDTSLKEVQLTLESLSPEQAKDQIVRTLEDERLDDVVAIFKGMPADKRKKIMGEFVDEGEAEQLHKILMRMREGEPNVGLIRDARSKAPAS